MKVTKHLLGNLFKVHDKYISRHTHALIQMQNIRTVIGTVVMD